MNGLFVLPLSLNLFFSLESLVLRFFIIGDISLLIGDKKLSLYIILFVFDISIFESNEFSKGLLCFLDKSIWESFLFWLFLLKVIKLSSVLISFELLFIKISRIFELFSDMSSISILFLFCLLSKKYIFW